MPATTLFQISDDLRALADLVNDYEGDIDDPLMASAFDAWFAELEAAQATKLDSYVGLIRQWEMEGAAAKEESERWAMKASVRANRVQRLKARLMDYMTLTGQPKLTTAEGRTIAVQKNGGVLPIIPAGWETSVDLDTYPQFSKRVLDPKAVRDALADGQAVPFAALGERGSHVRIK